MFTVTYYYSSYSEIIYVYDCNGLTSSTTFQYKYIFLNFLFRKLDPKLSEEDIDNLVSSCAKSVYSVEIDEKTTKSESKVRNIIKCNQDRRQEFVKQLFNVNYFCLVTTFPCNYM